MNDLNLASNNIPSLQADQISAITELKRLQLGENPITEISFDAFAGTNLEYLSLTRLSSKLLKGGIFHNAKIANLDLSYMNLDEENAKALAHIALDLIGLNISGNPDLKLDNNVLDIFPSLTDLGVADMGITAFKPDYFRYQSRLERLDISRNKVEALEENLIASLRRLVVRNLVVQ